jgi:hypothetical protein
MVLLGICSAFVPKVWGRYSGGTGEPNDPYRIVTPQDLNDIGNYEEDWHKHFVLVNDVNLAQYTGTQFNIIGKWFVRNHPNNKPFTGVFDGNDHKILNFTWTSDGIDCVGLFRYIGNSSQIKNLGLENVDVNAVNGELVGVLVGYSVLCTITKCYSSGSISGSWEVGGLVGHTNGGIIADCYSAGSVSGYGGVGGLIGSNSCTITDCYSTSSVYLTGSVTGTTSIGGLMGSNVGTITNCYSTGSVSGAQYDTGGFVGNNVGTITDCHSTGNVSGDRYVGGLVGRNDLLYKGGKIINCYSTGSVSGTEYCVGGLVGGNYETITDCYSNGSVTGSYNVGGLAGYNNVRGMIACCYSTGDVSANKLVGGLVGYNGGSFSNCFCDTEMQTHGVTESIGLNDGTSTNVAGLPTVQMQTGSTFTDAGWDFIEIWGVGENQTYPYLRFAPAGDFNYDKRVDLLDLAIMASHWLEER